MATRKVQSRKGSGDDLLAQVRSDLASCEGVHFFPVRHHSPACAWQLARLLREVKPAAVLVEGPKDFNRQITPLLNEQTQPPVALYTSFADRKDLLELGPLTGPSAGPRRFAAFYPFCEYSPEFVALRVGHEVGARLRFIDLPYPDQMMARRDLLRGPHDPRAASLLSEDHFRLSQRLAALAQQCGCRDHDELWDHLFEQRAPHLTPHQFAEEVAVWCALTRTDQDPELLEAEGTAAREHHMAREIRTEVRKHTPVVVVTGGFHTVALPALVRRLPRRPAQRMDLDANDRFTVMVRYSFDRLDALNGYSAGMPSPEYYRRVWQSLKTDAPEALLQAALGTLVEIGRLTRTRNLPVRLSVADEVAALTQARHLAQFRGHAGPTREDVLDAMRSCFVKGAMDTEGAMLTQFVRTVLAGDRVGTVPPDTPVPPLVNDFHRQCLALRLELRDNAPKNRHLHLYRSAEHRRLSQFFHRCRFLGVALVHFQGGPDFVEGLGLELLQEHWKYSWNPGIEARLIDLATYGTTVAEAACGVLAEQSHHLAEKGQGRSAEAQVGLLFEACRMGLHEVASNLLADVDAALGEDPDFAALVAALGELTLLHRARAPLEGNRLQPLPDLIRRGYERACALLNHCGRPPEERVAEVLEGIVRLRELARDEHADLNQDLLLDTVARLAAQIDGSPHLVGGTVGVLFTEGRLTAQDLFAAVDAFLHSVPGGDTGKAGYLRGLLFTCREALWQVEGLLERLDSILAEWSEEEFLGALPELRLGLAVLTPREVERVATSVGRLLHGVDLGELVHHDVAEADVLRGARITAAVRTQLERDGLAAWLEDEP